ncbi:hypothetical protein [Streptomyces sp. NPDC093990]|uniref:hypothetical protein n=1 Tax=Streptomyces sp. NPDC093990 TaxID=3155306 RepID=UPI00344A2B2B
MVSRHLSRWLLLLADAVPAAPGRPGRTAARPHHRAPPETARELVSPTVAYTAGLWPFAHTSPAVSEAQRALELAATKVDFVARLGRILHVAVTRLLALR